MTTTTVPQLYSRSFSELFFTPLLVLGISIAVVVAGAEVLHASATNAQLQPVASFSQERGLDLALGW